MMDGFLFEPTAEARAPGMEALLDLAGIGAWRVDLPEGVVSWSAMTRRLHEVDDGFTPTLETAIAF
jgi:hypothetical protein